MKKILSILAGLFMLPLTGFAQVTSAQLMGLGMPAQLAAKVASIVAVDGTTSTITSGGDLVVKLDSDANRLMTFAASSDAAHTLTFGDAGTTAAQTLRIGASTSDADDDSQLALSGGGSNSATRGSYLNLHGNEHAGSPGVISLVLGGTTSSLYIVGNDGAQELLRVNDSTNVSAFNTQITSTVTTDIGWSIVNAANQACNTTCTNACVFGFNTGALGNLLSCSDATADSCLCAGSN